MFNKSKKIVACVLFISLFGIGFNKTRLKATGIETAIIVAASAGGVAVATYVGKWLYDSCCVGKSAEKSSSQGKIVVLNGNSSAGKSSVSRNFLEIADGQWQVVDGDYLSDDDPITVDSKRYFIQLFENALDRELSSKEKAEVEKGEGDIDFSADSNIAFSDSDWEKVKSKNVEGNWFQYFTDLLYKRAIDLADQGKNVIVPIVFCDNKKSNFVRELATLRGLENVFLVLVYCPFSILSDRVHARNLKALREGATAKEKEDFRPLVGVLNQFSYFYKAAQQRDFVLGEITLKEINAAWVLAVKERLQEIGASPEKSFDKYKKEILENLNIPSEENVLVRITPRYLYDCVINTGAGTPVENAQQLKKCLTDQAKGVALEKNFRRLEGVASEKLERKEEKGENKKDK